MLQEINLNFFALFLLRAHALFFPRFGSGTFVDIGSGLGKSVIAAGLTLPWSRCAGIEVMEDMHEQSLVLLERWREAAPGLVSDAGQRRRGAAPAQLLTACADATALAGDAGRSGRCSVPGQALADDYRRHLDRAAGQRWPHYCLRPHGGRLRSAPLQAQGSPAARAPSLPQV